MPGVRLLAAVARGVPPAADGPSDADLVGRFAAGRDEAAFALLVRRHGPAVFGVCRRLLGHHQDAEDAFQAVFVVLARRAGGLRRSEVVGNWLYGVAVNVARKARAARLRRSAVEREAVRPTDAPAREWDDLAELVDRELAALPDKYRAAVVLCDLNGRTVRDAAGEVGCPPKTLGTRLLRGRALLAGRLSRRGVTLPAAGLAVAVPPRLSGSVLPLAAGRAAVPPAVAALTHGALTVTIPKTLTAVAVLAGGLVAAGLAVEPPGPATPAAVAAAPAPVPDDPPAWKHFKAVCGDTKESRALFDQMTTGGRLDDLNRAASDPAVAATEYAAAVVRTKAGWDKAYKRIGQRNVGPATTAALGAALREEVPPADVLAVLFLGSFALPEKAADPTAVYPALQTAFLDLVGGPNKAPARRLFVAWLDRRRDSGAVMYGLQEGALHGAVAEAVPSARRLLDDPKTPSGVLGPAALVVGNFGAPAADLPRLAKLRDDARPCLQPNLSQVGREHTEVRDAAAAMSLLLRGEDFERYGFRRVVHQSKHGGRDEAPFKAPHWFDADADRDAALKKAWAWLDAQPEPKPPAVPKDGKRHEFTPGDLMGMLNKVPKKALRLRPGDTAVVTYPIDPDDIDIIRCMTTNGRVTVGHEPGDRAVRIVIRSAVKAEAQVGWEVVRTDGSRETWRMAVVFEPAAGETLADRELKKLAGTWRIASQQGDGTPEDVEEVAARRITFRADGTTTSTARVGGRVLTTEGRLEFVGEGRNGVRFDVIADDGMRSKALYRWADADTVRVVAATKDGADRPADFTAEAGSGRTVVLLKRVKE